MEREKLDKAAEEAFEDYLLFSETTDSKSSDDFISGFKQGATKALTEQWRSVKDELPKDGEMVLIREYFRSARSGRYVNHIREFMFFEKYGFELEESINKHLGYRITHWMHIPALRT